jgi:uncharacterized protein (DUF983 family)
VITIQDIMQDFTYHFEHRNAGPMILIIFFAIDVVLGAILLFNLFIHANTETAVAMVVSAFVEILIGIEVYKKLKEKLHL